MPIILGLHWHKLCNIRAQEVLNMNLNESVKLLKEESNKNPAANALFLLLAMRKRTRQSLSLRSVMRHLESEGFKYSTESYIDVFRLLGKCGVGVLDIDPKGRVRGLKQIRVSLQSIGLAVKNDDVVKDFKPRTKFLKIVPKPEVITKPPFIQSEPQQINQINLELPINGKSLKITIPKDFTSEELARLINRLYGKDSACV